jgi:pSer/pThr/pTyr-binding forkhead associated (FHA) protein
MTDETVAPPPGAGSRDPIGQLRVTAGPDAGRVFSLGDETVIGRDDSADIVLADPT